MKTPEEIKKGLKCCAGDAPCKECPYYNNNDSGCGIEKNEDALEYIRDLEAAHRTEYCEQADYDCVELGKARKRIKKLETRIKKLEMQINKLNKFGVKENCTNCAYGTTETDYCYGCRWFDEESDRLKWEAAPKEG